MYKVQDLLEPRIFSRARSAAMKAPKRWCSRSCQIVLDMAPGSETNEDRTSLAVLAAKVMAAVLECIESDIGHEGGALVGKEYG